MTTDFEWNLIERGNGSATHVAFIRTGALLKCQEWDTNEDTPLGVALSVVFIPGATRADFFKDEP